MITAIVFVKADVARIPEVAEEIAALDGVSEVYSVTGQIDLIALVRVRNHDDVADVVADRLNKVPGVTGDRDAHRVPGLLPARPGVGVLPRPGLTLPSGHIPPPRTRRVVTSAPADTRERESAEWSHPLLLRVWMHQVGGEGPCGAYDVLEQHGVPSGPESGTRQFGYSSVGARLVLGAPVPDRVGQRHARAAGPGLSRR